MKEEKRCEIELSLSWSIYEANWEGNKGKKLFFLVMCFFVNRLNFKLQPMEYENEEKIIALFT